MSLILTLIRIQITTLTLLKGTMQTVNVFVEGEYAFRPEKYQKPEDADFKVMFINENNEK